MLSLEAATGATILDAAGEAPMEDETCLEGPMLKCTPQEERVLLNLLLTESLNHLEDMLLGYLNLIVACINEIRKTKASQMPVTSPRALSRLLPPQPISTPSEPAATSSLGEAIYSATSNLGTSVPHQTQRMPTHPPDQAKTDQAVRVLEGINKAPGTMPDHSKPWTAPWRWRTKIEERKLPIQYSSRCKLSIQVTTSPAFKSTQVQCQFLIFREVVALSVYEFCNNCTFLHYAI